VVALFDFGKVMAQ